MKETISLEIKQPRLPAMSIGDTKIIDGTGENGATFYPSVSADGVISWTNNKGLENPEPVNIRGGNGKDGYSPTINISKLPNGNRVTINDKNGTEYIDILNGADGQNGADGVGIKSVEKTATNGEFDTYTFNFTDGKTFSFTIKNGKDGEDGADGRGISSIVKSSTNGLIDNYTINFTDGSKTTFSVTNGKNGVDGTDGKDGTPATHEWQGTRLVITSASGTSSADLKGERGIQGIQGEKGDPFFISKVYNSVAEMHADYSNNEVKVGQFVVIETGNVNDEDNAKLFIKGNTSYEFLTDLSGAQGMQGPAGVQGEQGDQGPAGVQGVGIRSIAKTDTQGIQDIYTITLTDGRTATFSVTNGTNGNDGVSVTNASIDSNGNLVISLSNGNELTLGKVVGSNGKDGADGTSVTIERINENTSDGGSSTIFFSDGNSINIKNGATGGKGEDGKNGTSVTITKVTESTADGGSNVVDFSDGKSLSVKNGSKGSTGVGISKIEKTSTNGKVDTYTITLTNGTKPTFTVTNGADGADGYTPVKGVDYYTAANEAEWSEYIASELAKRGQLYPEFANSVEECTDTTKLYVLPDGFIYASVKKTVEGSVTPNFTNQIDTVGYTADTYLSSSSGNTSAKTGYGTTGLIKIPSVTSHNEGQVVLYLANVEALPTDNYVRIGFYKSDKSFNKATTATNGTNGYTQYKLNYWLDENNEYIVKFDLSTFIMTQINNGASADDYQYVRICGAGLDGESIVTLNEEITYTTVEGGTVYEWINTGHAFVPADYEDRIISLETDLATAKEDIKELQNSTTTTPSGEIIPQAVVTGASDLVDKALSRADGNVLRFVIYSDAHQYNENAEITKGNIELGKAIGEVVNQIGVDFVSGIGDSAWASYENTAEEVKAQIKQFNRYVYPYIKGEQILNCEGNHDDAVYSTIDNDGDGISSSTEKLSLAETFSLIYARNKNVVFDAEHYLDGYCYKDFEHLKVRVICLNTEQGTGEGGVVESYQIEWLEDVALNMTDKTDWQVVTLAHHPFSYGTPSLNAVVDIIDAFIKNGGKYIGHFHGHAHAFSVVKMQKNVNGTFTDINAWEICIPNACYTRNNQYLGNTNARLARYSTPTTYNKTGEDGKRTSFNLVTVCLDTKKIYADNYGAGIDREISY